MRKIITILVISIVVGFFYVNHTFRVANYFSDSLVRDEKEVTSKIKVLAIDDKSLTKIGKWPWPRNILAETSDQLLTAGAKAVFIDVLYTEPSQDVNQDKALQEVVNKYNNLYLAANFVFKQKQSDAGDLSFDKLNRPIVEIPKEQQGHINVLPDRDKVVRKVILGVKDEAGEMLPAISVRLANLMLAEQNKQISWNEQGEFFIGDDQLPTNNRNELNFLYATSPAKAYTSGNLDAKFETIPVYKVINGEYPPAYFQDSIVLIGPYTVGLQDAYYTPMSKTTQMFGVEIHANIIQSLLDGSYYSKIAIPIGLLILLLSTIVSYLLIDKVKAKWGFLLFILFGVVYTIIVRVLIETNQVLLPYFYVMLAFVLVYITSIVSNYLIERQERAHVTNLFGRYVSKGVVDEILSTKEDVKLGGVRKEVTLVFVDIRGFTPLSEKMEPEEVIVILNEYLDLCTRSIFTYEGTLDKFMGDGVMSFFGAPMEQPDHAERAVKAALLMKSKAGELATRLEEKYGRAVHFGIGINTGPAVIGNIGAHDRLDYTAIGDTVNLSARLESNAKPGQILISENTFEVVKDKFRVTPLDPIKVKGKEKPVTIYQVEGEL